MYRHGLSSHPLCSLWRSIKNRCYNPNEPAFVNYGGRGIQVCSEWKSNLAAFHSWATTHGWEKGLQIDRVDNDGNYSPSNCRFTTRRVNCQNRRSTYLTPAIVAKAKAMIRSGEPSYLIRAECGLTSVALYQIKIGRIWSNIL